MHNALSIVEPFGDLIISRKKTIEVRSWIPLSIPLKNVILVQNRSRLTHDHVEELGLAIRQFDIVNCRPWSEADLSDSCCTSFIDGYYAWEISNIKAFIIRTEIMAKRKIYQLSDDESFLITESIKSGFLEYS